MYTRLFFRKHHFKVLCGVSEFKKTENGFGTFARLHADKNL